MTQLSHNTRYRKVPTREKPSNEGVRGRADVASDTTRGLNEGNPFAQFTEFLFASARKARPWTEFTEKWPKMSKAWSRKELIDGRLRVNFRWFKGNYVLIVVIAVVCFAAFSSPFLGILGCAALASPDGCKNCLDWVRREYPKYNIPLQLIAAVCLLVSLSGALRGVYYGLLTSGILCCLHAMLKPRPLSAKVDGMKDDAFSNFVRHGLNFCGIGNVDYPPQRADTKNHTS